jgi:hypothetical protein
VRSDQQRRVPRALQQKPSDICRRIAIKERGWLIEKKKARFAKEGASQGQAGVLAAAQAPYITSEQRLLVVFPFRKKLRDDAAYVCVCCLARTDHDILQNRSRKE